MKKLISLLLLSIVLPVLSARAQQNPKGDSVIIKISNWIRSMSEMTLSKPELEQMMQQMQEAEQSSQFRVTYLNNVPVRVQAAVEKAADILENQIISPIPINVHVRWINLPANVLGVASANVLAVTEPNIFAEQGAFYSIPLLEKLFLQEINPANEADIVISLDNFSPWYLGTDANPNRLQLDLVTVALHEIVHGLGYIQNVSCDASFRSCMLTGNLPFKYVSFLAFNGTPLPAFDPTALYEAVTSRNVVFQSEQAAQVNNGEFPQVYAPSEYLSGSSLSHLDPNAFPLSLMKPTFPFGEAVHTVSAVSQQMLGDLGWINTYIIPELLPDEVVVENFNEVLEVPAVVFSDSALLEGTVELHYFFDDNPTDVQLRDMQPVSGEENLFVGQIPLRPGVSQLSYFITAQDNSGRSYRSPREEEIFYESTIEQGVTARQHPQLQIYPSPANHTLNIQGSVMKLNKLQIEVYDLLGKRLLIEHVKTTGKDFKKVINIQHFPEGVYLLKVRGEDMQVQERIFIR
jgi:hypothetical protein